MATIFSNAAGQVIEARDIYGTYYYLADGLGEPTDGAWEREQDAIDSLGGDGPDPNFNMDDRGHRLVECAYCGHWVRPGNSTLAPDDDEGWEEAARDHSEEGCEWVVTRAHRRAMVTADQDTDLRGAILGKRWGEAAEMVRPYCQTATTSGINTDDLADWLAEGTWPESTDEFPSPREIAVEWDALTDGRNC